MDHPMRLAIPQQYVLVGPSAFDPAYLDLLRDFSRLPRPRLPDSPTLAMVTIATERMKRTAKRD